LFPSTARSGFRERLLADPGFMIKVAIEVGIGICTKTTAGEEAGGGWQQAAVGSGSGGGAAGQRPRRCAQRVAVAGRSSQEQGQHLPHPSAA
jgi:hypothetical protein